MEDEQEFAEIYYLGDRRIRIDTICKNDAELKDNRFIRFLKK